MTTFLVGLDDSIDSIGALETAVRLGAPIDAELALDAIADEIQSQATAQLERYPGSWKLEQVSGDPTAALIEAARRHRAELIVVGHRGHNELVDLMVGSVASRLVHHSPVSVLVAKKRDA